MAPVPGRTATLELGAPDHNRQAASKHAVRAPRSNQGSKDQSAFVELSGHQKSAEHASLRRLLRSPSPPGAIRSQPERGPTEPIPQTRRLKLA